MNNLEQLEQVAKLQYDQKRVSFAKIIREESILRSEINRIAGLSQTSSSEYGIGDQMQVIGADVLWRSWVNRSKTQLNLQLAKVLARKAREQNQVKQAFGKLTAISKIHEGELKKRLKTQATFTLNNAIITAVLLDRSDQ